MQPCSYCRVGLWGSSSAADQHSAKQEDGHTRASAAHGHRAGPDPPLPVHRRGVQCVRWRVPRQPVMLNRKLKLNYCLINVPVFTMSEKPPQKTSKFFSSLLSSASNAAKALSTQAARVLAAPAPRAAAPGPVSVTPGPAAPSPVRAAPPSTRYAVCLR